MAGPTLSRALQLSAALRLHCGKGQLSVQSAPSEVRRADPGGTPGTPAQPLPGPAIFVQPLNLSGSRGFQP